MLRRSEFIVPCTPVERSWPPTGDAWLQTLAYNSGPVGHAFPDVELMHVRVGGTSA